MVRVTEKLVRKKAEHNELEIFSLEELSLHQENIEKIEHIDKWCRNLKILYLHNNLIPKIENLSRLKKLEYVNFTLNNIKRIENLEGCESLRKLDLTVNFIGELTSVENLANNYNLQDLYLTGNPCTDYEGYREYVIITLPQLTRLDGIEITKSERIVALQKYKQVRKEILEQQSKYLSIHPNTVALPEGLDDSGEESAEEMDNEQEKKEDDKFWNEVTEFSPETRIQMYKHVEKSRRRQNRQLDMPCKKVPRKLILENGRILNANEPDLDFQFIDKEEENSFHLDLATYKYLDISFIDVDVQPNYVRVTVKGKVFQMCLPEEVHPDASEAQRSLSTGHLLIIMPKVKPVLCKRNSKVNSRNVLGDKENDLHLENELPKRKKTNQQKQKLDVSPSIMTCLQNIVSLDDGKKSEVLDGNSMNPDFYDNPEVPPLM